MDETLKQALEALKLVRDCKITLRDQAVVDAAIAAIEQHKPVVRMLTEDEIDDCFLAWLNSGAINHRVVIADANRKFAEVNGLTIGEHG